MDAINTLLNAVVVVAVVGALVGALYYACIIPNAPAAFVKIFRKVQKDWHCAKGAPMHAPKPGPPQPGPPQPGPPQPGSPKAASPRAGAPQAKAPSSYTLHKCVTIDGDHPTTVPMQFTSSSDLMKCAESCEEDSVCQAATYNMSMGQCYHSSGFGAAQWQSWQHDDPFCMQNEPIPCYGVMVLPDRGAVVNIPPSTPQDPPPTKCT